MQPITYIHPFLKLISDGTQRIGNFSTSFTSIPHQALLDHHCTCITWKFGMPLETFQQTTYQNTTIPQILGPTSISTNTTTHYTPTRIIQHTGHIQIQRDYYQLCHHLTELQPTTDQHMTQKKLIAFPRDCPQLAHRNCHHQGYTQHQNQDKPTDCNTDIAMQYPSSHCFHIKCY